MAVPWQHKPSAPVVSMAHSSEVGSHEQPLNGESPQTAHSDFAAVRHTPEVLELPHVVAKSLQQPVMSVKQL